MRALKAFTSNPDTDQLVTLEIALSKKEEPRLSIVESFAKAPIGL